MPKSQFSEIQYVIGYLKEYLNRYPSFPHPFWLFNWIEIPSTKNEPETGADFIFRHYSHSEFIQFKRSYYLKDKRGLTEPEKDIDSDFFSCYRFNIYNTRNTEQFETLRKLADDNPSDEVYYCVPCFHSNSEFRDYFGRNVIVQNSVRIDCQQFNQPEFNPPNFDIGYDNDHKILFNGRYSYGWLCSKPIKIKVRKGYKEREINREEGYYRFRKLIYNLNDRFKSDDDYIGTEELSMSNAQEVAFYLINKYNIYWLPLFFY